MAGKLSAAYDLLRLANRIKGADKKGSARKVLWQGLKFLPGGRLSKLGMLWSGLKLVHKAIMWWQSRSGKQVLVAEPVQRVRRARAPRVRRVPAVKA